jgi:hypothetical protein
LTLPCGIRENLDRNAEKADTDCLKGIALCSYRLYHIAMSEVINPHDSFFRETFGRRETAAGFLREYLPRPVARQIDLTTLSVVKDSFVDKELRQHFSDLLYTVHHQQGSLYLYLLFEHKGSLDRASAAPLPSQDLGAAPQTASRRSAAARCHSAGSVPRTAEMADI